ncbi:MAG: hypothetical protein KDA75_18370 [Planctomycetaceae bacterium]|nr:hypothetical protein [Planctomycetaceae bacterium]
MLQRLRDHLQAEWPDILTAIERHDEASHVLNEGARDTLWNCEGSFGITVPGDCPIDPEIFREGMMALRQLGQIVWNEMANPTYLADHDQATCEEAV